MLEVLTGTGLAAAAGLNAYVPLLAIGLASRLTEFVELPGGWSWLENEWVLGFIGVLLVIEMVADKIPAVDTINDWIQTIVRPTAGGIAFGSGSASQTAVVDDPAGWFADGNWVPVAIGVVLALLVHIAKATARPLANAATFGLAAPALSAVEDVSSVALSAFALLAPVLVVLGIAGLVVGLVLLRRRARRARERRTGRSRAEV